MAIGIGIGLPFRRGQSGYPRAGLTGRYVQLTEGGNLINTLGGTSIPYVSGTGLDQIFDFSVLNNDRFDKGSYIGNSFGLPEYYNFPYVGIYYDATSATTRHYWKITDFALAVFNAQSITLDNQIFLKALATTNTSNIIASWSELLIYSIALTGNNLSEMKTYIGIQNTFYGNELLSTFDFTNGWTSYRIQDITANSFKIAVGQTNGGLYKSVLQANILYYVKLTFINSTGSIFIYNDGGVTILLSNINSEQEYEMTTLSGETKLNIRYFNAALSLITFNSIVIKQIFRNYYKS